MSAAIVYLPDFSGVVEELICFETAPYNEGFPYLYVSRQRSALQKLTADIFLGKSLPDRMIVSSWTVDSIVAATVVTYPQLVLYPEFHSFVDYLNRIRVYDLLGSSLGSVLDKNLYAFLTEIQEDPQGHLEEVANEFLSGYTLPNLPENLNILDTKGAFVYYEAPEPEMVPVLEQGYVGGIFRGNASILVFRKSNLVHLPWATFQDHEPTLITPTILEFEPDVTLPDLLWSYIGD